MVGEEIGKHSFGAEVTGFEQIERPLCFNTRGDGYEAEQAAGVVAAVFVLGATVHGCSRTLDFTMLAADAVYVRVLHHLTM